MLDAHAPSPRDLTPCPPPGHLPGPTPRTTDTATPATPAMPALPAMPAAAPCPGDVLALPPVRYALVTAAGDLRFRHAPGRAVWTGWELPDQAELRAALAAALGGIGPGPGPLEGRLVCYVPEFPALHRPNPVAAALLDLLRPGAGRGAGRGAVVRGPVALLASVPGDPVTPPLDERETEVIGRAHARVMAGRHAGGSDAC